MKAFSGAALFAALSMREVYGASSTSAAISLNLSSYNRANKSDYARSVRFEENTNYDPCLCNLTSQTCDAFCCCDPDCAFVSTDSKPFS